ncbi:SDR family NAD(P)-dependent oxidoreductase [Nocardia gamkensis]|uniref:SDR family oxidoreductase n=1 Tax=Nocardia gamkensis TaxID=352869 RepID=A0A7X6R316_9NOCA|nr:SDR family NAD(P)-dependent oxidoreductase [Nocardia gamkensis]NKY26888.1 SDR family oxidoreductase [Nocardia gamkensis]NQE68327.1 putative oxidoreductase EphD [Nocardia gamkensis]
MGYFADRVVAITGAGSGIGRELAVALAGAGAWLALSDKSGEAVAETGALCAATGREPEVSTVDVTDRAAVLAYAERTVARFGRVEALFNNAGILHVGSVLESPFSDFEQVMAVDFWGVVNGTKAFLPHLLAADRAHVVNMSSAFGLVAVARHAPYNAAKFAVRGFTDSLRQDMRAAGGSVRVTGVYPGGVLTGIARSASVAPGIDAEEVVRRFEGHVARTSPAAAARTILRGAARGEAKILVGLDAIAVDLVTRIAGSYHEKVLDMVFRS